MTRIPNGILSWDLASVASALQVSPDDVREYFTDGRRVSFLLERRIAYEIFKGKLAPSEGAAFDLIDQQGQKWEVRSITRSGIYFCPSRMVGSQRSFDEAGFVAKLAEIAGYVISDVDAFPNIPFWVVKTDEVRGWWQQGDLGAATKISRRRVLELLV